MEQSELVRAACAHPNWPLYTGGSRVEAMWRLPPRGWQVVLAVEHMHAHGIVHCDIKAENIVFVRPPSSRERGAECPSSDRPPRVDAKR